MSFGKSRVKEPNNNNNNNSNINNNSPLSRLDEGGEHQCWSVVVWRRWRGGGGIRDDWTVGAPVPPGSGDGPYTPALLLVPVVVLLRVLMAYSPRLIPFSSFLNGFLGENKNKTKTNKCQQWGGTFQTDNSAVTGQTTFGLIRFLREGNPCSHQFKLARRAKKTKTNLKANLLVEGIN